jgi:hypothetical protein
MKMAILFSLLSVSTFASARDYQCISDRLQAYNSDIYYDISAEEIEEILETKNDGRYWKVKEVAKSCEKSCDN